MEKTLQRFAIALSVAFALGACGVNDNQPRTAKAGGQKQVLAPWESASTGGSVPSAPSPSAGDRVVPLPDFTPLMKIDGPAVVNVITTNTKARNGRPRGGAPSGREDDPMAEFFRRFMPGPGG